MKYWSYDEYLGIGLGASSFAGGLRFKNSDSMYDYVQAIKNKKAPTDESCIEKYTLREEMGIFAFTGLRKAEGIDLKRFEKTFGIDFFDIYDVDLINKYKGKLLYKQDRLCLSESGMDISNKIMAEFI